MTLRLLLMILTSVALSAVAQLLFKLGMSGERAAHALSGGTLTAKVLAILGSAYVIGGFLCYGVGAAIWLLVLARADLSLAYPFVGLGFVLTAVFGVAMLGEALTVSRLVGTLLIIGGCILVSRSA
jgi:multidrug transporter EmrE-like cation transporter